MRRGRQVIRRAYDNRNLGLRLDIGGGVSLERVDRFCCLVGVLDADVRMEGPTAMHQTTAHLSSAHPAFQPQ